MLKPEMEILFEGMNILTESNITASEKREATNIRARIEPASDAELLTDFFVQGPGFRRITPDASHGPLAFAADMMILSTRTKVKPSEDNPGEPDRMLNGEEYVIRLVPISGRVKEIEISGYCFGMATSSFCRLKGSYSPGILYLYIFFEVPSTPLGPIEIPRDFREYSELQMCGG